MSNNNDNSAGAGLALVAVGCFFIGAFIFALIAFASLLCTIVAFCAWFRPLKLFGETLTPEEARTFVKRGIAGAFLAVVFAIFAAALFKMRINDEWLGYILIGGYSFGSIVVTYWIEKAKAEAAAQATQSQMLAPPPAPTRTIEAERTPAQTIERPPFRFASWDDEEELRK